MKRPILGSRTAVGTRYKFKLSVVGYRITLQLLPIAISDPTT